MENVLTNTKALAPTSRLRLLQTTDLHMQLLPFDYQSDRADPSVGLLRLVPLIAQQRAQSLQTLLFDCGDLLQGSSVADVVAAEGTHRLPHPMVKAFNEIGYDALTLGNHDFDYGLDYLHKALAQFECSAVLANVQTADGQDLVQPTLLRTLQMDCADGVVRPLTIGIIGLVTPQVVLPEVTNGPSEINCQDPAIAAAYHAPKLRAAGADIIIALCHFGLEAAATGPDDHPALAALPDIDVVMTGHVHGLFPSDHPARHPAIDPQNSTVHGKPAVMSGAYGSHLGQIDLALDWDGSKWSIAGHDVQVLTPNAESPPADDPVVAAITQAVTPWHTKTRAHLAQTIAQTHKRIFSHFTIIESGLSQQILGRAARHTVRAALSQTVHAELPLLATSGAYNAGRKIGSFVHLDIQPGPLTLREVAALYPYTNPIVAILRNGQQLRDWLEHASSAFATLEVGRSDQALLDPQFPAYHCDTIIGLHYNFDLSRPAGQGRVRDITYNGVAIKDDQSFVLASNSFRLGGGGGYPHVEPSDVIYVSPLGTRDSLTRYLTETGAVNDAVAPVWDFSPLPGTHAYFDSSRQAAELIDTLQNRQVRMVADLPDQAARFELSL